ncbi:hypothetical protein [Aeromicrobium senzhongii]|uniref:hypothetical protein n=1 Tax=Aeromicrobium senzhongii TaxID=2663859 RepID=UPI001E57F55E|nr:hypothetical protein [Aeromicrobium senzhongii]
MTNHTIAAPIRTWAELLNTDREVLTRTEVASLLDVDPRTVDRAIEDGTLFGSLLMSPRAKPTAARARREKGTGSISTYQTKSGPRWRYEIQVPVEPGHPEAGTRVHTCAGFASYEDADEALTLVRADVIRKIPQAVGRDTFTPYARRWLDGHSVGNGTRMYIQRVIDAMDPYIGHLQLTDIRPTDLAAAYRGLERGTRQPPSPKRPRKGLATSTVARYANWVNTIFLAALDEGLIVKNPANSKHAGRPKGEAAKRVKPFVIWNVEQLTRFCDWHWPRTKLAPPSGCSSHGPACDRASCSVCGGATSTSPSGSCASNAPSTTTRPCPAASATSSAR